MLRTEFEQVVADTFERLPAKFRAAIDNVAIVVEDYPDEETVWMMGLRSEHDLLGLYQGIPLPARGTWYGMSPAVPDRIFLYQKNIERISGGSDERIRKEIYITLVHEIGHYFGMSDNEIREAGY